MAALLVVAVGHAMAPPRALPCEKIHPFHCVPLFLCHDTSQATRGNMYEQEFTHPLWRVWHLLAIPSFKWPRTASAEETQAGQLRVDLSRYFYRRFVARQMSNLCNGELATGDTGFTNSFLQ